MCRLVVTSYSCGLIPNISCCTSVGNLHNQYSWDGRCVSSCYSSSSWKNSQKLLIGPWGLLPETEQTRNFIISNNLNDFSFNLTCITSLLDWKQHIGPCDFLFLDIGWTNIDNRAGVGACKLYPMIAVCMPMGFTYTFSETRDLWQQIDPCEGVRNLY